MSMQVRPEGQMNRAAGVQAQMRQLPPGKAAAVGCTASLLGLVGIGLGAMWILGAVKWARAVPGSAQANLGKLLFGVGFGVGAVFPSFAASCLGSMGNAMAKSVRVGQRQQQQQQAV
jgi:hypothetical protein